MYPTWYILLLVEIDNDTSITQESADMITQEYERERRKQNLPSDLALTKFLNRLIELGQSDNSGLEIELSTARKLKRLVYIGQTAHQRALDRLILEGQSVGIDVDVEFARWRKTDAVKKEC